MVALVYVRLGPPHDAFPRTVGVVLPAVLVRVPVFGLSVAVPVPVVHPAIVVAVLVLLALVVAVVMPFRLPLDAVHV